MKLDVEFINPFIEGAIETLKTQCSVSVNAGKPFLKGTQPEIAIVIAGMVGVTSDNFNGSVALCFTKRSFLTIMSNMLGEKFEVIDKELEDGAGELINIIFGYAKRLLSEKGYKLQRAVPSIVRGGPMTVKHFTPKPTIVIPFETDAGGGFQIEIVLEA